MTIARRNVLLGGLLAALLAAEWLTQGPLESAAPSGVVFEALANSDAARVVITPPDGEAIEITRAPASTSGARRFGLWSVATRRDFRALDYVLRDLLARLGGVSNVDRVSTEESSHAGLGVDERGTRILLQDASGRELAALIQSPPLDGLRGSYVRPVPGDEVFRAAAFAPVATQAAGWLDTRLFECDAASIESLAVSVRDASLSIDLVRAGDGRFRVRGAPAGPAAGRAEVSALLRVIVQLVLSDVSDQTPSRQNGLLEARLRIALGVATSGETKRLHIGADYGTEQVLARDPDWHEDWCVALPRELFELVRGLASEVAASLE